MSLRVRAPSVEDVPDEAARGFHVPCPAGRPGDAARFGDLRLSAAGVVDKPAFDASPASMRDLAYDLIRVLDDEGQALGPWNPQLSPDQLRSGLRTMMLTRAFDDRMFRAQRQGKTSFYIKCTGEEAIAAAAVEALEFGDMCFPSYRQQGLLIGRGYPLVMMMNQIFNNSADPLKGRQLPILYSSREFGFYSLSGNVGSRFPHAVGWAMASATLGSRDVAAAWIGDGTSAEGDFHSALTFAAVYRAPVILNIVNNQWAISSFQGLAGGAETTFAARGQGYGLPALRVDGNDFLAVYAATSWARSRARAGLGATLIELFTYRAAAHSTSDDPSRYRPADEAEHWPLGDPIARLRRHLLATQVLDEAEIETMEAEALALVRAAAKEAEAIGTLGQSPPSAKHMFEGVFATPDWRLVRQRGEVGV